MKIFILIPWFSPAYKAGGPIQSIVNMVNVLGKEIEFNIFCGDADLDNVVMPGIETDQWIDYAENIKVWYASKKSRSVSVINREVENTGADILYINGMYSWTFTLAPLLFAHVKRIIVSPRGMLLPGALSQKSFKKNVYLKMLRILGVAGKCTFHASTEEEKKFVLKAFPSATVFVAPNFPRIFKSQALIPKTAGSLEMASVAIISPMKNYLLVLKALMLCNENVNYHIWGTVKDDAYWKLCNQQIALLPSNIQVEYHGEVLPQEVEKAVARCHIFILPSISENFGHAIFEALSCGRPVITSENTPWNDLLRMRAGVNVATDEISIAKAIGMFAGMGQVELAAWTDGAKEFANKAVDVENVRAQYLEMFSVKI